jgi:hypothetical protein
VAGRLNRSLPRGPVVQIPVSGDFVIRPIESSVCLITTWLHTSTLSGSAHRALISATSIS